jgi:hypothetical protein
MGTHCTPAIADLFICVYRYIYLDFYPKLKIKPSRYSSTITIDNSLDIVLLLTGKLLKILKGVIRIVYRRRTDNTMAKRKSTKGQTTIYKTYI